MAFSDYGGARPVKGGIKAQGKLKGTTWWSSRWMAVLEGFYVGGRLTRGRTYARKGQVMSLEIAAGVVTAKVQGSRPKPYSVELRLKQITDWKGLLAAIDAQSGYAARLLNGEMPPELEALFAREKVSLFPERSRDLETSCSCPDWSNPCKHVAAVFYLLGEEFERDPFLLFRLRGIEREELARSLHAEPLPDPEPIEADPALFWGTPFEPRLERVTTRKDHAALVRQLGPFPFWRGETRFLDEMEELYAQAAARGNALLGRLSS